MKGELSLFNRQRTRRIDLGLLRRIIRELLVDLVGVEDFDFTVHVIGAREMTGLNETSLGHAGSTDVITFDYSGTTEPLAGEIFVCLDEAILQAARFRTTWPAELVRYLVHGVLHLRGFDDRRAAARAKMKREENRLLKELSRRFDLSKVERPPKLAA